MCFVVGVGKSLYERGVMLKGTAQVSAGKPYFTTTGDAMQFVDGFEA